MESKILWTEYALPEFGFPLFIIWITNRFFLESETIRWLLIIWTLLLVWFYRPQPDRVSWSAATREILSPCEGKIYKILKFPGGYWEIVVHLDLTDNHLQYCPLVAAKIIKQSNRRGKGDIERARTFFENSEGRVVVDQIVKEPRYGSWLPKFLVKTRIVNWAVGDINGGQSYGMIRFGSMISIYLPRRAKILVRKNQQLKPGILIGKF